MSLLAKWKKFIQGSQEEQETEFLPAVLEVTETPPSPVGRLVLWTIIGLLVVGIFWSFFGKIDEVAVATGKIVPVGQVKTVQAEDKGIVKAIHVKEGDYVKAGQLLIELDPTSTGADLDSLKKRAAYYELDIARLNAELQGAPFSPSLSPDLDAKDVAAQTTLYLSRVSQHQAEVKAAQMAINQSQATLQAELSEYDKYTGMLAIAMEKEERLIKLVEQNAIAAFQLLDQTSNRIEVSQAVKTQNERIQKARAELAESEQKLANADATYNKEVMTALVEARRQLYAYNEELKKASEKNRLSRIVAPVDGRVHQLAMHTVGGIVTAAQGLLMIVPDDVTLEMEVWANNRDIGFIKLDQLAEVKVETFNFQKFGVVEARVSEISPDALNDPSNKENDKKYRLGLTLDKPNMLVGNAKSPLSPGMTVTAEIKIKEKRIIDFFLDPFRQYTSEALRER